MGIDQIMRVVFLDRDGVLNRNVVNSANSKYESPYRPEDFHLHEGVIGALHRLQDQGYTLIIVTNQPGYAKGTTSLENIRAIGAKCEKELADAGIKIQRYCCCLHYPHGVVPEYSGICQCRKPSPYMLLEAIKDFGVTPAQSWMIGDRATDIECGQGAGVRTILVKPDHLNPDPQPCTPDFEAENLVQAVEIIFS